MARAAPFLVPVALAAVLAAGCGGGRAPVPAPAPPPVVHGPATPRHAPVLPKPSQARATYPARPSRAVGSPVAGRLVRSVRLPAFGPDHVSWDPIEHVIPAPAWRRNGTDRLVRVLLRVTRQFRDAHPGAPRLLVGDLSRPHGGDFGARVSGGLGHASHQNGLDADVYYPRRDGRLRAPRRPSQVDRRLAQDLVDRFVDAGAQFVFTGPHLGLRGPAGVVQALVHHDDHLHVRLAPR